MSISTTHSPIEEQITTEQRLNQQFTRIGSAIAECYDKITKIKMDVAGLGSTLNIQKILKEC
jgi:hypothetical protein